MSLERDRVIAHEVREEGDVALLFADEEFRDSLEFGRCTRMGKPAYGSQQSAAVGMLSQLKRRDGACDELPFVRSQDVRQSRRHAARMLRVILEVIQPDAQIDKHGGPRGVLEDSVKGDCARRSEEHTSELQSPVHL